MKNISIIVPTWNEEKNIGTLVSRLDSSLKGKYEYEIIFIDDKSSDLTVRNIQRLSSSYPIQVYSKKGRKGKSFSIVEGFLVAKGEYLVMIDADLQYPPEAITKMLGQLERCDVVVANREKYGNGLFRRILSKVFRFTFGKMLFDFDCDIQSGLKVFKREVFETTKFTPHSGWSFDLEFLERAKQAGYLIESCDIEFSKRQYGVSKISFMRNGFELVYQAILLKLKPSKPVAINPLTADSMLGAGVGYKEKKYITHTNLPVSVSAVENFLFWQQSLALLTIALIVIGLNVNLLLTITICVALLSLVYFFDTLFNVFLVYRSLSNKNSLNISKEEIKNISNEELPSYSILCPLYKEGHILPNFVRSIENLDWPKEKLDVLLLIEDDDLETRKALANIRIPSYFRIIEVPYSVPKTKPKACNYGLGKAKGEFLVIYDAEDIPEPTQLKKAYLGFKKVGAQVACLQAKLNYFNSEQNLLTRFFTAEYSLWFDIVLPGLQSFKTAIPLGGTSNHFKTKILKELKGWDPFNVTEDADLGVRLFKAGYKTSIIDSTTLEEANSELGNWIRQRSRWIKGYIQTYLVHNRNPISFAKGLGVHALIFQLLLGGKIAFIFINPFLWVATISYFVFYSQVGSAIEAVYPTWVFYLAVSSLVFGNFMFMYLYMIGCAQRNQWSLIKFVFLIPFYWLVVSVAGFKAFYQLIFKPYYWEKTIHGLHLPKEVKVANISQAEPRINPILYTFGRISSFLKGYQTRIVLITASLSAYFFNFLYNAYLVRSINVEQFGLVSLMGSFLLIATIPFGALTRTVTHKTAFLLGKYENPVKELWSINRNRAFYVAIYLTSAWVIAVPLLAKYSREDSMLPFLLLSPVWLIGLLAAVDTGFLTGSFRFTKLAILIASEAVIKFILTVLLVETGNQNLVYAAIPFSMGVSLAFSNYFVAQTKPFPVGEEVKQSLKFPKRFYITSLLTKASAVVFLSVDLILAKFLLSPEQAGEYAILSLFGKVIFLVGSLFSQFIDSFVSREIGANKSTNKLFFQIFSLVSVASISTYLVVGLFGKFTAPLLLGPKTEPIIYLLPFFGFGVLCFTLANSIVSFYQIRHKNIFPIVSLIIGGLQISALVSYPKSLEQFAITTAYFGVVNLIVVLIVRLVYKQLIPWGGNFLDFRDLFKPLPSLAPSKDGVYRILIFSWRDLRHKWSGGSEVYVHNLAKEYVKKGHSVILFCGTDRNSPRNEIIDGVYVIRRGGFYTVYLWAFLYYFFNFRKYIDVVIDNENGIPFFTPLYAGKKVIGLMHHVHQEVFRRHLILPFALLARFLESRAMPLVYRNVQMITVSKSSKEAMEKLGLGKVKEIQVINPGIELNKFKPGKKTTHPSIVYLGRLKEYKSVDTLIKAMPEVLKSLPETTLTIAGEGETRGQLEKIVKKLKLEAFVNFVGKVTEEEKKKLLSSAWVMVQPSLVEGWGLTIIEANASGTPVVAANVPGLRDSVKNPHTGYLVNHGDASAFANRISFLLNHKETRSQMSKEAVLWARKFDWKSVAEKSLEVVTYE